MNTLYELTEKWQTVLSLSEEGADEEAIENALADIGGEIEEKADGYAKIIKQLEGEAEYIKQEKDRLSSMETTLKNKAKYLKRRLEDAMILTGKNKFKTSLFCFNIQKNAPSLIIEDEAELIDTLIEKAPEMLHTKIEIDKKALLSAIKGGAVYSGAKMQQSESLRIR